MTSSQPGSPAWTCQCPLRCRSCPPRPPSAQWSRGSHHPSRCPPRTPRRRWGPCWRSFRSQSLCSTAGGYCSCTAAPRGSEILQGSGFIQIGKIPGCLSTGPGEGQDSSSSRKPCQNHTPSSLSQSSLVAEARPLEALRGQREGRARPPPQVAQRKPSRKNSLQSLCHRDGDQMTWALRYPERSSFWRTLFLTTDLSWGWAQHAELRRICWTTSCLWATSWEARTQEWQ